MPQTVTTKPYDWTYTTTYAGSLEDAGSGNAQWVSGEATNALHAIPIAELSRPDPILFYAEIPLFEDELHDNGASHLLVRIVCPLPQSPSHVDLNAHFLMTERVARYANMHLHIITVHVTR
jgi:hypothetical protein